MARTPLYKAAEAEMIRRIEAGTWEVGRRLPNEFVLAEEFGVSQGTMRRALMTLEGMGLLSRKPGRGTIVAETVETPEAPTAARTAAQLRDADGQPVAFEVHRAKSATRGADEAELALFGKPRLAAVERLLKRNGERAALEETLIPETLIPALDEDAPVDLEAFLIAHGLDPAGTEASVSAGITTMADSVALSCDRHTPLLVIRRVARDGKGRAIALQVMRVAAEDVTWG
ncbi:GntR family transcriptional regulator [Roseibacterium sp. SDUM158016]|uniref:GntR family transcriptional regulator n=1 Tax=Roseicyclus sediminis TaxID=2980997 RepID=UPI0021D17647|nr:GntR family transcriptional regulator [Roseibacterium sp. SDUM158016]MCU4653049.1 GntR family transcriptional regulator [Roseibacterium sp. SDUM158016]